MVAMLTCIWSVMLWSGSLMLSQQEPGTNPKPKNTPLAIAVVVSKECEVEGVTLSELRAIASLEKQFWPSNRRIIMLLRPSSSPEMSVVLGTVYRMSAEELRKMWVLKLFAGRIPAIPTSVKTAQAVSASVARIETSLSFVSSEATSDGMRVLTIDGKLPGEPGYPLTAPER